MYIKGESSGYHIIVKGQTIELKPAEAEELVTGLLSEMGNIPDRLKLAWEMRIVPRAKVIRSFKFEDGEIREYYHIEVYIPNDRHHSVYVGPESTAPDEAVILGFDGYGKKLEITETVTDVVSKKLAEKEANRANVAKTVQEKYGMSMKEIMVYVNKHKELPPEVGS